MEPLISVVIPTYNREKTILRALNSVLRQTYSNIEAIVVDDGSTDSTAQIVGNCADERVRLISFSSNQGANKARNVGISEAKGEYIAFQDSDDEWMEDKLEKQLAHMLETSVKAVYCPYILFDAGKTSIVPEYYRNQDIYEKNVAEVLKKTNIVGTPTLMVKRELFSTIGMFDEDMKRRQDYEFIIRLAKQEPIGYVKEPLVKVYRMEESITSNMHLILGAYARIFEKHSDFIDIENSLHAYLGYAENLWDGQIHWSEFDKIAESIEKSEKAITREECHKLAIQYFYQQDWMKKSVLTEWYYIFRDSLKAEEFAIYGAGVLGQEAYHVLKKENYIPRYFIVTKREEENAIDGVPIKTLAELENSEIPVLIAVSWEKQKELIKNLVQKGIYRFCIYPFC